MNIVFWIGVIALAVLIWFCLSFAFREFGKFWLRLFNDAKEEITKED